MLIMIEVWINDLRGGLDYDLLLGTTTAITCGKLSARKVVEYLRAAIGSVGLGDIQVKTMSYWTCI